MEDKPIKLKLTGKVTFEDELSLAQAAQIISFLSAPAESGATLNAAVELRQRVPGGAGGEDVRITNPRDALNESGAKTNPEKIVALAAYVLQDGSENFTLDTIKPLFRRARETPPANLARDLDTAIRFGWITETEVRGEYFLNNKAEGVLSTGFDSIRSTRVAGTKARSADSTKAVKKTAKKPGKTSRPDAFTGVVDFPASLAGVPSYHKVVPQKNKMLFVLKVAKDIGVIGLASKSIVWLTDHYGEAIAVNNISAYYRQLQRSGHANKTADGLLYRITPSGEDFLASLGTSAK